MPKKLNPIAINTIPETLPLGFLTKNRLSGRRFGFMRRGTLRRPSCSGTAKPVRTSLGFLPMPPTASFRLLPISSTASFRLFPTPSTASFRLFPIPPIACPTVSPMVLLSLEKSPASIASCTCRLISSPICCHSLLFILSVLAL